MPSLFGLARLLRPIAVFAIVVVLLAGCLAKTGVHGPDASPDTAVIATPTAPATVELTPVPVPTDLPATPGPVAVPAPFAPWLPTGSPLPPFTGEIPAPTPAPPGPPSSTPPPPPPSTVIDISSLVAVKTGNSRPTRIAIPALHIDLPVIKGNPLYPKCDVAQYMTNFVFPGQPGTTYLYGHARAGMFLPLLNQSQINDGAAMIGMLVELWTADTKLHLYRINIVKRHAVDFSLATNLSAGQHRLILQTSEGPHGTIPKLQIAAKPIGVYASTAALALPTPHPVTCG
jgi:hypothetical protein